MDRNRRRRTFLRAAGVAAAATLGGCVFGGGGGSSPPGPGGSYEITTSNRLEKDEVSGSGTATVTARVERQVQGDNEVLFERTLDLDPGESRTFEDAFERGEDGTAYIIRGELAPDPFYSDPGPRTRRRSLRDGLRFVPGTDSAPATSTYEVGVVDGDDDPKYLVPTIQVGPPSWLRN
jgi:hypothetical protein